MSSSSFVSTCNILDIPDEILVKIISHFNARERLALAYSCERFNSLVFGDKELLGDLDFSKNGRLTQGIDIRKYFRTEATCKLVRKINIQNVECIKGGHMLNSSIGRAINLTDVNILGTKIKNMEQLESFLEPLVYLKRLSINWPKRKKGSVDVCSASLEKRFSKLTHLSVVLTSYTRNFLNFLKVCQELEELHMVEKSLNYRRDEWSSKESDKLRNLKIIQYRGWGYSGFLMKDLVHLIPDPTEWADFYLDRTKAQAYFERNVEMHDELRKLKLTTREEIVATTAPPKNHFGWSLIFGKLLKEAITVTHEDVPDKFCCLEEHKCWLNIHEAKRLLKDPGYNISYLYLESSLLTACDTHLVASAFPNLRELVLCHISDTKCLSHSKIYQRRLRRRGSTSPMDNEDPNNEDSSFKMLVENTPHLRGLTISSDYWYRGWWDLGALYSISHWKNLTAIRLKCIPITHGKFLIYIGKNCEKLEELQLSGLCATRYTGDLVEMLIHCKNLRNFSMCEKNVENMSQLFNTLSNNSKLETVRFMTKIDEYNCSELLSSVERMLHGCLELTKFVFVVKSRHGRVNKELKPGLLRIMDELNRPGFRFYGPNSYSPTIYEDASTSFFFSPTESRYFARY